MTRRYDQFSPHVQEAFDALTDWLAQGGDDDRGTFDMASWIYPTSEGKLLLCMGGFIANTTYLYNSDELEMTEKEFNDLFFPDFLIDSMGQIRGSGTITSEMALTTLTRWLDTGEIKWSHPG